MRCSFSCFLFGMLEDTVICLCFFLWSSVCPLAWSCPATSQDLPVFIRPVLVGIAAPFRACACFVVRGSAELEDMLVTLAPDIMSNDAVISI